MAEPELLMVKLFKAGPHDYEKSQGGGKVFKPCVRVTQALRRMLVNQVAQLEDYFAKSFSEYPDMPCVAKVMLRDTAYAKSKRPINIFTTNTCPVIGGNRLGNLYASVTPSGLRRLKEFFRYEDADKSISQISTVEFLEPFQRDDALGSASLASIQRLAATTPLKLQLFDHVAPDKNRHVFDALSSFVQPQSIQQLDYPGSLIVYEVRASANGAARIASFAGTEFLGDFPKYGIAHTQSRNCGGMFPKRFLPPVYQQHYPLVGLIDTGTDPHNKRLQMWVHTRDEYVPAALQNNFHGSFIAGLLSNAYALNENDDRFPNCSCKIVDVVAFDKSGEADERRLMMIIKDAVVKYPEVRVWNLSFAIINRVVTDHSFSPLAMLLEDLRQQHGVSFVVASGNVPASVSPPQSWPRIYDATDRDRVCSPADAPTAVVVGGVSHLEKRGCCVKIGEPSPWTRHGPGAAFLPSPHLSHISGNCCEDGDHVKVGVYSFDGLSNLAEDVGTSYAAPLVSGLLSHVTSEVSQESEPHVLSQALLLHSAFIKNAPIDAERFNYVGVGTPPNLEGILHCRQSSATAVFEVDFGNYPIAIKHNFPIPDGMREGDKVVGEILMTLAYIPPMLPRGGFEYCQTNVCATLGKHDAKGAFKRRVHTCPSFSEETYERDLIRYGYKWSPIKHYYRNFTRYKADFDNSWKLRMSILCRSGWKRGNSNVAYLVITMRNQDPDRQGELRIYDEMVRAMAVRGWSANDLKIRSRFRDG